MIPLLAGVDYAQLWVELQDAIWWVVICAIALGQVGVPSRRRPP